MKKILPITLFALLLTALPVDAVSEKANEKAHQNAKKEVLSTETSNPTLTPTEELTISPTATITAAPTVTVTPTVSPTETIKNKRNPKAIQTQNVNELGECDPNAEYKNHGEYVSCVAQLKLGGQTVAEAARSNIGKKNSEITATPTLTVTPTEPVTPPVTSALESVQTFNPLKSLSGMFDRFIDFFKNLI